MEAKGRLNLRYKKIIDDRISYLKYDNISVIYGEHVRDYISTEESIIAKQNNAFVKLQSIPVLTIKAKTQLKQVKLIEKYLVDSLRSKYGNLCLNNNVNDNEENEDVTRHDFYIMYDFI